MSAARGLLACLLCLPLAASALIVLSMPPVSDVLPAAARERVRDLASPLFDAVAALPPDSLVGWVFYGTYAPLVPVFGSGAIAAHAVLLALPWLALVVLALRWARPRVAQPG